MLYPRHEIIEVCLHSTRNGATHAYPDNSSATLMGRICTICSSPSVDTINALLGAGTPYRTIAATFGVAVGSLSRHLNGDCPSALLPYGLRTLRRGRAFLAKYEPSSPPMRAVILTHPSALSTQRRAPNVPYNIYRTYVVQRHPPPKGSIMTRPLSSPHNGFWRAGETARFLGVNPSSLYYFVHRGYLVPVETPAGYLFDPDSIRDFAEQRRQRYANG